MRAKSLESCLTLCDPMDCSPPGSVGFSRQEYWSGLPCPSQGDLPNPVIESRSLALQTDSLPSEPPGKHPDTLSVTFSLSKALPMRKSLSKRVS